LRAGLALFLLFATGEAFVRLSGALDAAPIPRRLLVESDLPGVPYLLRPAAELAWFGEPISVNARGLRGPEVEPMAAAGTERVLVLGDSVVFGWRVADEAAFPAQLQQILSRAARPWEVLNAGVPGYDTSAAAAFLQHVGLELRPDVVVLGVSLNDFTEAPELSPMGVLMLEADARWLQHSELALFLRWRLSAWRSAQSSRGQDVERFLRAHAIAARDAFYGDPPAPGRERILEALRSLRQLTSSRDTRLLVVIFPEEDQLSARALPPPQALWLRWCRELELECLDLRPHFARAGGTLFVDLQHPNATGLELAAVVTAEALTRE
jgi:lysophospholipase L1-like esterase